MSTESKINLPVGSHPAPLIFRIFRPGRRRWCGGTGKWSRWNGWRSSSDTDAEHVLELAAGLGLRVPPVVGRHWLDRGYVTLDPQ